MEAGVGVVVVDRDERCEFRAKWLSEQQEYLGRLRLLIAEAPSSGVLGASAAVHLECVERIFVAQNRVLEALDDAERIADNVLSGVSQEPVGDGLDQLFPDLVDRELATRDRLVALSRDLPSDAAALREMMSLLEIRTQAPPTADDLRASVDTMIDEWWCSTQGLRRRVIDDAHARVVVAEWISSVMQRQQIDPVAYDASVELGTHHVTTILRSSDPRRLRETLGFLMAALPTPVEVISGDCAPVGDDSIIDLPGEQWISRDFWPAERERVRWRERLGRKLPHGRRSPVTRLEVVT